MATYCSGIISLGWKQIHSPYDVAGKFNSLAVSFTYFNKPLCDHEAVDHQIPALRGLHLDLGIG